MRNDGSNFNDCSPDSTGVNLKRNVRIFREKHFFFPKFPKVVHNKVMQKDAELSN